MLSRSRVIFFTALLFSLIVAACSDVRVNQPIGEVFIRDGQQKPDPRPDDSAEAFRILPYALLADQTYKQRSYKMHTAYSALTACGPQCPEEGEAERILASWRMADVKVDQSIGLPGLAYQIWIKRGKMCKEVVIAFRGTNYGGTSKSQYGNWVSNLHWLFRLFGVKDQYSQVREKIKDVINDIEKYPCYSDKTTIIAVGHSLGAGLAQHASYVDNRIDYIYEFDPTFVTGSFDPYFVTSTNGPLLPNLKNNLQGLTIERIYEHGEVLAFPRFITRHIHPPKNKNPHTILTRFNVIHGNILKQHKIILLNTCLLAEAYANDMNERKLRRERLKSLCGDVD